MTLVIRTRPKEQGRSGKLRKYVFATFDNGEIWRSKYLPSNPSPADVLKQVEYIMVRRQQAKTKCNIETVPLYLL